MTTMPPSGDAPNDRTQDLAATLAEVVFKALETAIPGVALVYFLLIAIGNFVTDLPEYEHVQILIFDLMVLTIMILLSVALRRHWIKVQAAHAASLVVVILVQVNILNSLWIMRNPIYIMYGAVVVIGAGAVMLSTRHFLVALAVSGGAMLPGFVAIDAGESFALYPLFFCASVVMAAIIFRSRLQNMVDIYEFRVHDAATRARLAQALEDSEGRYRLIVESAFGDAPQSDLDENRSQYSHRLKMLQEVDRAILAAESPAAIGRAVLNRLIDLQGVDGACLVLIPRDGGDLNIQCMRARGLEQRRLARENGTECWTRRPPTGTDELMSCARTLGFEDDELGTVHGEALTLEGHLLGVLLLVGSRESAFGDEYQGIARELADRLTLALRQNVLWQEAESERQRLEATLEQLPEAVFVLDRNQHLLFANETGERQLPRVAEFEDGSKLERIGGAYFEELLSAGDEGDWISISIDEGEPSHFEAIATPLLAQHELTGFIVVIRDVTRDKKMQEHAFTQQRLAAVGQLASGIAHDFNNILQIIMMNAEMMRHNPEVATRAPEQVNGIIRQTKRASTLVRQILDFSRKTMRSSKALDLGQLVGETVELLERTIHERVQLTLDIQDDGRDFVIRGDAAQLQQVLTNLVLNSQDAMPDGGRVEITLSSLIVSEGEKPPFPGMPAGRWILTQVADNGSGMSKEIGSRAYEPFFTTKETGKGTGLGLAQVYGIVKAHEGFIDLSSTVGQGTTFFIYLPRIDDAQEDSDTGAHPVIRRGKNEVIVIVEDEASLLEIVASALEAFGYEVHPVGDPEEAVDLCARLGDTVDVVISDVVMPKLSGPKLLKKVRASCPTASFVMMTGYPLDEHLDEDELMMDFEFIKKPFTTQYLIEVVTKALAQDRESQ